jgi:hypothetical protein
MMTDPDDVQTTPDSFADLPLQPTGSGVADLEIAYEQMKLADTDESTSGETDPTDPAQIEVVEDDPDIAAHPS